jgi:hypothetical protein
LLIALQFGECRWFALMIEAIKELSVRVNVLEQGQQAV